MVRQWLLWISLAILAVGIAFLPLPFPASQPAERTIRIEASQYAFTPGEVHVNPGDRVTLELISTDVVHGLYIDSYGLSTQADPGQTARLEFTADRPGTFRLRCDVTCGAMHPFMIGKLYVGQNTLFYRGAGLIFLVAVALFFISRKSELRSEWVN
jgi:heme/copper-type cytochrome/quinol oxidase subunit 2